MSLKDKAHKRKRASKRVRLAGTPSAYRVPSKESREIVLAIHHGKIDALVMAGTNGPEVLTLQGTDHPYRVLVETINDGVATLDAGGILLYANPRFGAIFDISVQKFIGTALESVLCSSDREVLQNLITEGLSKKTQGEITLRSTEGCPRLIRLSINPVKNSYPSIICMIATEMTELVEANRALKANEESLRQLSARLLQLQDDERRRISRDLHDITGQKLAFQYMGLSHVLHREPSVLDEDSRRTLTECAALSKQVGDEIRTLSYLLHPPLLDELGLSSAVRWFAEGYERRTGIQVQVEIATDFGRLPAEAEVTLFRVIQESLTNVHRYSGSLKAYLRLERTTHSIHLHVGDFGKGIRPEILNMQTGRLAPLGVGIQGMTERMRQLGGKLEINSPPGQGTQVTATLPVTNPEGVMPSEQGTAVAPRSPSRCSQPSLKNLTRKQILIADDHELLRRGLRTMLEKEKNWEICGEAVDGQDAVDQTLALSPDLVILDINMPVLNGLEAGRRILRDRPQTKILIFTAFESQQTLKEIKALGAHGYLSKCNATDDLWKVVKDLLEVRESSSAAPAN
ncbi:MAG: hypothetical protein NVS9B13_11600 [Candidatus Acidiferrum sp.]